jgi:hypothetical protein
VGVLRLNGQAAAVGHRVTSVHCQVYDDVLELVWVSLRVPEAVGKHRLQLDVGAERMAEKFGHPGDKLVQIQRFWPEGLLAREDQQPLG